MAVRMSASPTGRNLPPGKFLIDISVRRMSSFWMLRRMALVKTNVSEELGANIIKVKRIDYIYIC
jgi:hypothetical protein